MLKGNLEDSNACASTTLSWPLSTSKVLFLETPKTGTVSILSPEINDFLQNRQLGARSISISLCFEKTQNSFPVNFPRSYSVASRALRFLSGLTNVNGLALAAFDLVYCSLHINRSVFVFDISNQLSSFFSMLLQSCWLECA